MSFVIIAAAVLLIYSIHKVARVATTQPLSPTHRRHLELSMEIGVGLMILGAIVLGLALENVLP